MIVPRAGSYLEYDYVRRSDAGSFSFTEASMINRKEAELMKFLEERVFNPILQSTTASRGLKNGVRLTMMRMNRRDAAGMVAYYWSAVVGTERSTSFARQMRKEKFTRFEECIDEFRDRFDDAWVKS